MTSSRERNDSAPAAPPSLASAQSELLRARSEALNVVQWLARIAHCYVTSGPVDRRTDLDFRAEDAAFVTKTFDDDVALEMGLPDLHLQFLQNGKPVPHVFDPQERSPAETEAWILVELLHRGIDREKFSKKLLYAVPDLLTGDAHDYAPHDCRKGLVELTTQFRSAAAILKEAGRLRGAEAAIICLPQTLELALDALIAPSPGGGPTMLGFSPGDAQNWAPYFYAVAKPGSAKRAVASALLVEKDATRAAVKLLEVAAR
jgi:hypothetical protein